MARVKLCGVTSVADAELCVSAGADALGLNFYARSARRVERSVACEIAAHVRGRVLLVGVFVDAGYDEIAGIRDQVGLECVQLHGDEPPALLARFLPHAYKAVRVRDASSIELARSYGGEHVMLDAYVEGQAGGTGQTFSWPLAEAYARERRVTLAGGLTPDNVVAAIAAVNPYCVDVASGIERAPGVKDAEKVARFVRAAKGG